MRAKNDKKKFYSIITGLIIILSLVLFLPTCNNTFKIKKENEKDKKALASLTDKTEKLEMIDENETEKRVKLVEEVFPSQKPVLNLLNSLSQLSNEEEVVFSGMELKPGKIEEAKTTSLQEFEISFNIEGRLANISSFINNLERIPPLMKIENLNLRLQRSKEESEEEVNLLKASFSVRVFYQPTPETIGSIEQPVAMLSEKENEVLKKISFYRVFPKIQPTAITGKENLFLLP